MEVLVLVSIGPRVQNHEQFRCASVGPPPTVFGKNHKTQVASALRYEVPLSVAGNERLCLTFQKRPSLVQTMKPSTQFCHVPHLL